MQQSAPLELEESFKIAYKFHKEQSGKAFHLSYPENLKLIALAQQARFGKLESANLKPLGLLDVVGKERRAAWGALGDMSKTLASRTFINTLLEVCPLFKPYIEAVQNDRREKAGKEIHEIVDDKLRIENKNESELEKYNEEIQLRELQDALNENTYQSFRYRQTYILTELL